MHKCASISLALFTLSICFLFLPAISSAVETIVVSVTLNHTPKGDFFVKSAPGEDFLLKAADIKSIGLKAEGEKTEINGEEYLSLKSIRGVRFSYNESALLLEINADPSLLPKSTIDYSPQRDQRVYYTGTDDSVFLNYRFDYTGGDSLSLQNFNLTNELGLRTHELLFLANTSYTKTPESERFVRLTSDIIYDSRRNLQRTLAGDFFASSDDLGSTLNLGGLSFSKIYRIDPYFIKQPLFNTTGLVSAPSEADIYINGMLIKREKLSPGGFELKNISSYSGAGNVEVVIRDPFGREERLRYPFYFTDVLLKEGLHEYSYNIGFLRNDFGGKSDSYGRPAFSLFHRYGFLDNFSAAISAEGEGGLLNFGPQAAYLNKTAGITSLSLATSFDRDRGTGLAGSLSHIYQGPSFGAQFLFKGYSKEYSTIDNILSGKRIQYEAGAGISYGSKGFGSAALDYTAAKNYNEPGRLTVSATYSISLFRDSTAYVSFSNTKENGTTNNMILASLTYYPWKDASASASFMKGKGTDSETLQMQQNPPFKEGLGYRATLTRDASQSGTDYTIDPFLQYTSPYGIYTGEYMGRLNNKTDTGNLYEFTAAGGIVYVSGAAGITQPVADSFGLVKVGNLSGVKVYNNNQEVGETDSSGKTFIPNMNSYYDNQISLGNKNIPINYSISETETTVSPSLRSGSVIEFKATWIQGITGSLKANPGGQIKGVEFYEVKMTVDGVEIVFPTGRGGEFYLENIKPGRYRAKTTYMEKTCAFDIIIPDAKGIIINLGDLFCEDTI